jgi:alpha,alpha-trehalase
MKKLTNLNYGVIGNCRSAALISEYGCIEWCCLPDFDSPSIFARLIDKELGGEFGFEVNESYTITQKYLDRTNIVCTSFVSDEGSFEVLDFMPRYKTNETSHYAPSEIYRYIRHLSGSPKFKLVYNPRFNYATEDAVHLYRSNYIETTSASHTESIHLYSDFSFDDILGQKEITLTTHHYLLLSYNQKLINIDIDRVYLEYQRTKVYWLNWTNRAKIYAQYNDEITRSLLVLKLLSYDPTGAVLAALTTSLPETIGDIRNWDYRFCWIRDASMSIDTLLSLGHDGAARRFLMFIKGILKSKSDSFQIMYGIRGERELREKILPHLEGYEESMPVRIGNAAYNQKQNDIYGYLMNVIYQYYRHFPGTLDEIEDMWEIVQNIVRTVIAIWDKPDKGIWEIRGGDSHFVFSKVMCWVAMDRAVKIARFLKKKEHEEQWQNVASKIKYDILINGWNENLQSFTQTYSNDCMDASLLLMEEYGFIKPDDERFVKTVNTIKNQLLHNGLMYRYVAPDDFGEPASAFTICTFWLVKALFVIGQKEEAKSIFDKLLGYSNHLGLFSEDIDFATKRLLGNFPQAYSHLALINTARLLSNEKKRVYFYKP